jgi:CRP/FNR family transcriptional regulator, cyclic AMP receptor protein
LKDFLWENLFRGEKKERNTRLKIRTNILFKDLNKKELDMVEKIINVRNYRPGEIVFRQGEVGVGMYIIAQGTLNIYVEEIVPTTGETKSVLVAQLQEGDFFGDLSLVEDNGRRSASAIANEDCVLLGFFKPDLIEITQRNPSAGVKILFRLGEVLGTRLRETTAKITEMKKLSHKDN